MSTTTIYEYNFPTKIYFGAGSVARLPDAVKAASSSRPLIVTDRGLADLPAVTANVARLEQAGLSPAVYSSVWGNPLKSQVVAGLEAYRAHGADSIVGIGGGAALDVSKAIALLVEHPGDLFDYEDGNPESLPIDRPIPWLATVPTTAGTGSEVGRSAVVSDDSTHVKRVIFSPRLLARAVFADPELTLSLPSAMTAATGMDALTHLVEAYLARGFQPLCDGIALQGVRFVAQGLTEAVTFAKQVEQGDAAVLSSAEHLHARSLMLNAALMGGVAFQKGLGVTHSMAHALSTVCDLHHGLANGVCLATALRFNSDVAEARLADLATMVNASEHTAQGFIAWLLELQGRIGIPTSLTSLGVRSEHVPELVGVALADGCHTSNPKPVTDEDFERLFRSVIH
jgi:alcohol dehydrogenase class IV